MTGKRARKIRSDKEIVVAPTIPDFTRAQLDQLAMIFRGEVDEESWVVDRIDYTQRIGAKTVGEALVLSGLASLEIYHALQPNFYRDIVINHAGGEVHIFGNAERRFRQERHAASSRLYMDFRSNDFKQIELVAYALACRPATACGQILLTALRQKNVVLRVIDQFSTDEMDVDRQYQLRQVLRCLNIDQSKKDNLLTSILIGILSDCIEGTRGLRSVVRGLIE